MKKPALIKAGFLYRSGNIKRYCKIWKYMVHYIQVVYISEQVK